jgi:hypothetical protein
VHHAIAALRIAAGVAVVVPARVVDQVQEGCLVAVLEQVARALPAEDAEGGIAPGRAVVVARAGQELEEERRLIEAPALRAVLEQLPEQVLGTLARQETLLI